MSYTAKPREREVRAGDAKAMGAYYTDAAVAAFLVWWAVRSSDDKVMDPSFGGGVFLRTACKALAHLGGDPSKQVLGVEMDADTHARTGALLASEFGLPAQNLLLRDFFEVDAGEAVRVDAIVGNPPFIRYHRFTGVARERALARAASQGVRLTKLTSSWAPFLVHGVSMLKQGGRLAMVLPMEVGYAAYALPLFRHVSRSFERVTFLTFRRKLFPDLSEDTLLLLAEGKGGKPGALFCRDLESAASLRVLQNGDGRRITGLRRLQAPRILAGRQRLIEYVLPKRTRELYQELKHGDSTVRLGELADVGIGYVTGANSFFHLSGVEAAEWRIPSAFLRPAVLRGRSLAGLRFTRQDWRQALSCAEAGFLLSVDGDATSLPEAVRRYLTDGERRGVPEAYKCRVRSPWFAVPHVYVPDAFLTYMSGQRPYLVANDAGAVAPNSLHIVRIRETVDVTSHGLAALWQTSLTRLSCEIEGHAMGGGMLKLEPTEAGNVLLPAARLEAGRLESLSGELDYLLRSGQERAAADVADRVLLNESLGFSEADCRLLRKGAEQLCGRRYERGRRT